MRETHCKNQLNWGTKLLKFRIKAGGGDRRTNVTTTVQEIPTGVEIAASRKHVQPCVACGGWEGGWVMSQAHMLASVPDLLVSPVRHVTQQGAAHAPVCCDNKNMSTVWIARNECGLRLRLKHHTVLTQSALQWPCVLWYTCVSATL